jgi:glutamate dehydrogenase/leucine dehydrogenase
MPSKGFNDLTIIVKNDLDHDIGYVVINSILNNTSSGGVRILEDISLAEIKALAKEMTLKYSFIGLNRGGAKSGIRIPKNSSNQERISIIEEFGQRISPLISAGIYFPGRDMNCSEEDLRTIYNGAGTTLGKITNTSYFTAISVENAIMACKDVYALPSPVTLAIEGFGSVGRYLAERLNPDVFQIVALSTIKGAIFNHKGLPLNKLVEYKEKYGDDFVFEFTDAEMIKKENILAFDADILVPCARTWSINEENAHKAKARFIVPAANAPYTQGAINILSKQKTVCLPGFVCNSGGVYASSMFDNGISLEDIEMNSETYFREVVSTLLDRSRELDLSPVEIAIKVAIKRFEKNKAENGNSGVFKRIIKRALAKGFFPKSIYRAQWLKRFKSNLIDLENEIAGFNI